MIALLLMAIAVPVATKLVEQNQENRGRAVQSCGSITDPSECGYVPGCRYVDGKCTGTYPTAGITCTVGATKCSGKDLQKCNKLFNGSLVWQSTVCEFGCVSGKCNKPVDTTDDDKIKTENIKCTTGNGWPGTCVPRGECPGSTFTSGLEFDIKGCGEGLGCCGKQPSALNAKCNTGNGWPGTCTTNANCNQAKFGVEFDIGGCGGGYGCCGKQPGLDSSKKPSPGEDPTSPGEEPTSPGEDPTSPGEDPTSPGEDPTSSSGSSSSGGSNSSGSTGKCDEQCPGSDGVLRDCSNTTLAVGVQSNCNSKNIDRAKMCGKSCFVCTKPDTKPNPKWVKQTDLTICGTSSTAVNPILNYKISFGGVIPTAAQCTVNWPLQFIVLAAGESKVYSNVIATSSATVGSKLVFSGSLTLTGFTKSSGVAVFIKGPKHLQVKYGINNQSTAYNKAGGEITLTSVANTSPVYDFSQYPLIPGDVVGTNSEVQDGFINGVDYAYVKSKAYLHETTTAPLSLKSDLDGNCQANSNDVNLLKISLQEKQGQLY